ncbi:MAG: aminotransferase class III-fold pyridoxal phosphate-dependent enzyme [Candidatus Sericytochromatia bacterium]|nr:aminotransferase class III-fold pyridoxal phosphate-dependent enzyme [Candidatus Tanganyikabacteria bacterium]
MQDSTSTRSRKLVQTRSEELYAQAQEVIPGGLMGIRRPYNFVPGEYPIFLQEGKGGRVIDVDGNEYVDMLCAYGPIILGYREAEVDEAAIAQIRDRGSCFSLVQPIQNELAFRLRGLIPCAEMSIFVKTGSDATTLAVRLARGKTGRAKVLRCGYHGWHDWCVEVKGGVPEKLYEDVFEFHYNDLDELATLLERHGDDTAAIIVTPVGHPLAHPVEAPGPGFLEGVRSLADRYGAVLVFDEIRSGFRMDLGGAGKQYGVKPDLVCVGKAMANGYAIAAVSGIADVMKVAEKQVFVSSTYFPNSMEMAAALKTIEILERDRVLDVIRERGEKFLARLEALVAKSGVPAHVSGVPQMPFITFPEDPAKLYRQRRTTFYTEIIRRGVFLQPYHHGYICYRHTDADLDQAVRAVEEALAVVRDEYPG